MGTQQPPPLSSPSSEDPVQLLQPQRRSSSSIDPLPQSFRPPFQPRQSSSIDTLQQPIPLPNLPPLHNIDLPPLYDIDEVIPSQPHYINTNNINTNNINLESSNTSLFEPSPLPPMEDPVPPRISNLESLSAKVSELLYYPRYYDLGDYTSSCLYYYVLY